MSRKIKIEPHQAEWNKPGNSLIRLKGNWLKQMGFAPGCFVQLTEISNGVLQLTVLKSEVQL